MGQEDVEARTRRLATQVVTEWMRTNRTQLTNQEAEKLIALRVKLGVTEHKLRAAYAALQRAGVELIDITSIDEEPGLSYAIMDPRPASADGHTYGPASPVPSVQP